MSLKDSLINKLERQIDAWEKQVDAMRARAQERMANAENEKASAQIQQDFAEQIQRVENYMRDARKRLDEIREAGEQRLNLLRRQVDDWLGEEPETRKQEGTQPSGSEKQPS